MTIATTRPETMLGDTAVAVHPDPAAALDEAEQRASRAAGRCAGQGKGRDSSGRSTKSERRQTKLLPQLDQLRDMARRGVDAGAAADRPARFR